MASDKNIIQAVIDYLASLGITAQKIDECNQKTPDLRAVDKSGKAYIIEVKTKIDAEEFLATRREKLATGEIFSDSRRLEPSNTTFGNLKLAAKQLSFSNDNAFRIVFCLCTGARASDEKESLICTLYGREYLIGLGISYVDPTKPQSSYCLPCYYFRESAFFSYRNSIDAAIIVWPSQGNQQILLCLNDYSKKYEIFKESELFKSFTCEGVIDPVGEEAMGEAFAFRDEFDRKDTKGILKILHERYDDRTLGIIPMQMHTATIASEM